jgi:hypothetical protein
MSRTDQPEVGSLTSVDYAKIAQLRFAAIGAITASHESDFIMSRTLIPPISDEVHPLRGTPNNKRII